MQATLFCGIMYSDPALSKAALDELSRAYGPVHRSSGEFDFDFTDYYSGEFGAGQKKFFVSFERPIERESLPDIKLHTCEVERRLSLSGCRRVNIDPGYITLNNVVVASTKEFPTRIYLGKGIFGDLQLILKRDEAVTHNYTYADYKACKGFFHGLRKQLQRQP